MILSKDKRGLVAVWQFIVSGYVPGTDIQIDFNTLMCLLGACFSLMLLRQLFKERYRQTSSDAQLIQKITV